eukprot:CAMPEP_0171970398 /NCGR_PEP_ID=MMETSP0993-20121228/212789_1 /TAXON_ID=483369 /ORGANISM="non described non described, Strain CCMP2098" /LENGTH=54 /DNA_ID=CAMNT_0012620501 /DNA_START=10 /DNA_END=170 /DNA_ORIENTATION=-
MTRNFSSNPRPPSHEAFKKSSSVFHASGLVLSAAAALLSSLSVGAIKAAAAAAA